MNKQFRFFGLIRWLMPVCLHADGDETGGGGGDGQQQQQQQASTDLRTFVKEDGSLQAGWAKAFGAPDTFESKFTSLKSVLGSYASLESQLGRDKVVLPTENSTPEEWNAFYQKLGRPEKPDAYGIKRPDGVPDGVWDDKLVAGFQAKAHELGLTPKQAQALVAWQLGTTQEAVKAAETQQTQQREQAVTALKTEWGADYDKKVVAAKQAAIAVGGDALIADPTLANNPAFIKAMAKVGELISEDTNLPGGRDAQGRFSGDPKAEIQRINDDKNDPYWNASHPQHEARVQYMQGLFAKAYPQT